MKARAVAVVFLAGCVTTAARADWQPSGAMSGSLLFRGRAPGGSFYVDAWQPLGRFRLGGALGLAALSSDEENRSRVLMPIGVSAAVAFWGDPVGLRLHVRGGVWGGATDAGLAVGGWVAAGALIEYFLDSRVALAIGAEGTMFSGHETLFAFGPTLGLVWVMGASDATHSGELE